MKYQKYFLMQINSFRIGGKIFKTFLKSTNAQMRQRGDYWIGIKLGNQLIPGDYTLHR